MELLNTDQLNEKIKVTDEFCPTHQINLVQFKKPDGYTSPYSWNVLGRTSNRRS